MVLSLAEDTEKVAVSSGNVECSHFSISSHTHYTAASSGFLLCVWCRHGSHWLKCVCASGMSRLLQEVIITGAIGTLDRNVYI